MAVPILSSRPLRRYWLVCASYPGTEDAVETHTDVDTADRAAEDHMRRGAIRASVEPFRSPR